MNAFYQYPELKIKLCKDNILLFQAYTWPNKLF